MKNDLTTAIFVAIFGVLIGYLVCNLFVGDITDVTFKTIDDSIAEGLSPIDEKVFNTRALNPTVEVCVGDECEENKEDDCAQYDELGICIVYKSGCADEEKDENGNCPEPEPEE